MLEGSDLRGTLVYLSDICRMLGSADQAFFLQGVQP